MQDGPPADEPPHGSPGAAAGDPAHPGERHDPGPSQSRPLILAFVGLLVLTGLSWAFAHVPLGDASTPIALLISALKAVIVAIVFMELHRATTPARVTAFVTISFIAILAAGTVADVALR